MPPYLGKIKSKGRYSGIKAKSWAILSDYVRMRDFIKYGTCVATGMKFSDWRHGDAGHYYSMGGANGIYSGFSDLNVHLQSKSSNGFGGQDVGYAFGKELQRRYGRSILNKLKEDTKKFAKDDKIFHLNKIQEIYEKFKKLKEENPNYDYPDYLA